MRKLHLHLHPLSPPKKKKKNHANLNETVSIVTVIKNPFFVNYALSKAFSTVTKLKQKKLGILQVGRFTKRTRWIIVCLCATVLEKQTPSGKNTKQL